MAKHESNDLSGGNRDLSRDIDRIMACDDLKQLLSEFEKCFQITIEHVIKMGAYIRRIDELGGEVTFDFAMLPYLKRVAYKQMSPRLLVNLQGREKLLNVTSTLPLPDQEKIANNEPVRVMSLDGDNRSVPPLALRKSEIEQVFTLGRLRSDAEQVGLLRERQAAEQARAATKTSATPVLVDRKRGGIVVNGHFLSTADLAGYIEGLSR